MLLLTPLLPVPANYILITPAALGGNLFGVTSWLLGLDGGRLAESSRLDVLVPVAGFRRCLDVQNGGQTACLLPALACVVPQALLSACARSTLPFLSRVHIRLPCPLAGGPDALPPLRRASGAAGGAGPTQPGTGADKAGGCSGASCSIRPSRQLGCAGQWGQLGCDAPGSACADLRSLVDLVLLGLFAHQHLADWIDTPATPSLPIGTGEENISVVVAPIRDGFTLQRMGSPAEAAQRFLDTTGAEWVAVHCHEHRVEAASIFT